MTINEARMIRELKRRCTFRRLAEIYHPPSNSLHGVQMEGDDLCREAFNVLYPERNMFDQVLGEDPQFDSENRSSLGDAYWWE